MTTNTARLPVSVTASVVMHAAGAALWLYVAQQAAQTKLTVLQNVSFIEVKKAVPQAPKPKAAQQAQSTFDFLKMALPSVPARPKMMDVKLPEQRKAMTVEAPKLDMNKKRLDTGPKLDMDLDKGRNLDIAKVEARIPTKQVAALAAMPKLEEVGRKRVANLPQAIAMEERRQEAVALRGMDALTKAADRRAAVAQTAALQDAGAAPSSKFSQKIASLLPEQALDMKPAVMPAQTIKKAIDAPEVAPKRKAAAMDDGGSKKGVEIEGPLADRKVMAYEIPEFPKWAKDQGVLEANVSIRFWVNKAGDVLPGMRVEHTSGYGRLDRLAMDALSKWKFAPLINEEKQWGVITFRFILE